MFLKRGHEGLDFLPGRGSLGFEEVLGPTVLGLGLTVRYSALQCAAVRGWGWHPAILSSFRSTSVRG